MLRDKRARALVQLVSDLCAIPSVTGEEAALRDHIRGLLPARLLTMENIGNGLVARGTWREGRPLVTLYGHLDTVPPASPNPIRVEGDRLYGLGSSDMKSGLAVMIQVATALDYEKSPFNLGFIFYDREEGPFDKNGLELILRTAPWIRESALGLVLEPTELSAQMGCQGSLQSRVIFKGKSSHSARPWLGDNAIVKSAPFLAAMAVQPVRDVWVAGLLFRECFTVTMARGGRAANIVPDRVEYVLNYRFSPARDTHSACIELEKFLSSLDLPDASRPDLEIYDISPSCPVILDHPLVRSFLAPGGVEVRPKQAWTDVARLAVHGIPAFNYGPGLTEQCHQAGEYTLVSHLVPAFERVHGFLSAGGPS